MTDGIDEFVEELRAAGRAGNAPAVEKGADDILRFVRALEQGGNEGDAVAIEVLDDIKRIIRQKTPPAERAALLLKRYLEAMPNGLS